MAVYTPVSQSQLIDFLKCYDLGTLQSFAGIEQGVSNTNYHVTTTTGRYILTLFEPHRVKEEDIGAFIDFTAHLEAGGVPCPQTLQRRDGALMARLCDRPAAIFSFLPGEGQTSESLNPQKCYAAGQTLALMHLSVTGMTNVPPNHFGLERWKLWLSDNASYLDTLQPGLHDLAELELNHAEHHWPRALPMGAIHADYFPDNVFFTSDSISGVIDFHFVCHEALAYDLAIAANAWSFNERNEFVLERLQSLLAGYQSIRPLSAVEAEALPLLLRASALRFLLSRVEEKRAWQPDDFMVPHDPLVFAHRLRHWSKIGMNHVQS